MNFKAIIIGVALSILGIAWNPVRAEAVVLYGPTEYLCFDDSAAVGCGGKDSPFAGNTLDYFNVETFEGDSFFNALGVTPSAGSNITSILYGPTIHDSVDSDDGTIDGSGLLGESYFAWDANAGLTFTFNSAILGGLPTHAGLVWTDGIGDWTFQAFDSLNNLIGSIGPTPLGVFGDYDGDTADDRFFGVLYPSGIFKIKIFDNSTIAGAIEVDHLQYGLNLAEPGPDPIPEPTTLLLFGLSSLLTFIASQKQKLLS